VDSLDLIFEIHNRIHDKYSLPRAESAEDIRSLFKRNVYEELLSRGIAQDKMNDFFLELQMTTLKEEDKMEPYDGVIDALRELTKKGFRMSIISSNHSSVIHSFLNKYHIDNLFEHIVGGEKERDKVAKIKKLVREFGADKSKTFYIGDTVGDMKEGKHAGVKTVAVCWGYHDKKDLAACKPDFLLEKVKELGTFLN
jgi:phosphoglycolate phosphatase